MSTRESAPRQRVTGSALLVVEHLIRSGARSRTELSQQLDLSRASLTRLTKPLLESGLIVEGQREPQSGVGRPATLLEVVGSEHHFMGINLTGTRAVGAVIDLNGQLIEAHRIEFPAPDPASVLDAVVQLYERFTEPDHPVLEIGLSIGGYSPDRRTVARAPFLGWEDPVPLADQLESAIGIGVVVHNDLMSLTLAEQWFGQGRTSDHFAVLTIGAGIGYGLVVHDQVVATADAGLGLLGHHPVMAHGTRCDEGHRGCAGIVLSNAGLENLAAAMFNRRVTRDELFTRAEAGETGPRALVDDAGQALGRLIGMIANIAMPDAIVLAGEGVSLFDVANQAVIAGLDDSRDPLASKVELTVRSHDRRSWARGAAVVALQDHVGNRLSTAPIDRG